MVYHRFWRIERSGLATADRGQPFRPASRTRMFALQFLLCIIAFDGLRLNEDGGVTALDVLRLIGDDAGRGAARRYRGYTCQ